ncbi:unnamed protein product [Caenorhabditis auriculariae]|uniref:Uncharacterized protein n=1 Tax=Caenorhabditis auriculariae TaxID=2777116 RepID=A0A8S1HCW9_9PELO|nr:unnamed protein product [Caenorhabditis auriculariae]
MFAYHVPRHSHVSSCEKRQMFTDVKGQDDLRAIVISVESPKQCFVHLLEICDRAWLPEDVTKKAGYDPEKIQLGDVVVVDVKSMQDKRYVAVRLRKVEEKTFRRNGRFVTGEVFKSSFGTEYRLTNDVLGIIGDPNEIYKKAEDGRHVIDIVVPPPAFYSGLLNPTTVFSKETPFVAAMVPAVIDANNSTEELIHCEGVVVSQFRSQNNCRVYIFTKGCSPYTDVLALISGDYSHELPQSGTFADFFLRSKFAIRLKKLSASLEDGQLYVIIEDFCTLGTSPQLEHSWIGKFDDPEEILAPNRMYEEIKLEKVSGPDFKGMSPWRVIAATKGNLRQKRDA